MNAETLRWFPATPGNLPDTARTVLLWTPPAPYTCGTSGVFMGWLQAGKLRFCDARIEADPLYPRPAAWAEMPAGPDASGPTPAPGSFRWLDPESEPIPDGVPVLVIEADGGQRIARLDNGYVFDWSSGDNLDAEAIAFWAHLPAAPQLGQKQKEAAS